VSPGWAVVCGGIGLIGVNLAPDRGDRHRPGSGRMRRIVLHDRVRRLPRSGSTPICALNRRCLGATVSVQQREGHDQS
jgi:hypothetical protein